MADDLKEMLKKAQSVARKACGRVYGNHTERACVAGVSFAIASMGENIALIVPTSKAKAFLGFFQECGLPCKKGYEKVVLKAGVDPRTGLKTRQICICRLGPAVRKHFRGSAFVMPLNQRKAFSKGTASKPLRRCIQFDERRKRCVDVGPPGSVPEGIPGAEIIPE